MNSNSSANRFNFFIAGMEPVLTGMCFSGLASKSINGSLNNFVRTVSFLQASKYMDHFEATHCIALPSKYFVLPWSHRVMSGNVIS